MNISPSVIDLQYFQELHDRRYHVDIHSLPLMRRVAHLHQHLVKYSSSTVKRDKTYPDALACLFSMANAFNLNITKGFGLNEYVVNTLDDIGQEWCVDVMMDKYRQALGHMAKLLEASDHSEDYEYRVKAHSAILTLFNLLIQMYKYEGENSGHTLTTLYIKKIFNLKTKHIFYPHYHTEDLERHPIYRSFNSYLATI